MFDPKTLKKVVPEDILRVAQIIEILLVKYGPERAAFMLEQVAKALRNGRYPRGGDGRDIVGIKEA